MAAPKKAVGPKSDKHWRDALRMELADFGGKDGVVGGLRKIARAVITQAASGDPTAYKEIGDRLDGKPHQSVEVKTETTKYVINATDKPTREQWERTHTPEATTQH